MPLFIFLLNDLDIKKVMENEKNIMEKYINALQINV